MLRRLLPLVALLPALAPVSAAQARSTPQVELQRSPSPATAAVDGVQHLHFRFGPVRIRPGQNTISFKVTNARPKVDGSITSFRPNLVRADGTVPRVDVIHLHHAVWLVDGRPTWAAGEEKTAVRLPAGYGWRYRTSDTWVLNHMIHNLTAGPDRVWVTWDMDFVPATAPAAHRLHALDTNWVDAVGGKAYPVFDAVRGMGAGGRFTFPDQAVDPYPDSPLPRNQWVVTHDSTLVATAGHLHPGGLHTDLTLTRGGRTVLLFRSRAHYFEPAGAVSWDVSMTATPRRWRVAVKAGDVLAVHGTYDTARASWYEAMAIMPVAATRRPVGGADPFRTNVAVPGVLTHGHLPENDHHGGAPGGPYASPAALPDGPRTTEVQVSGFLYGQGDLSLPDARRDPAVVARGQSVQFVNRDASRDVFHTITGCRLPCGASTGIAFPLADGAIFDSGELGFGPSRFTAAANRDAWSTPATLTPGTYAYFCRVHPFMRGAFRVKG
jgi:plastocyanin